MSTWGTQNISEGIDIIVYFLVIKDGLPAPTCFNKDITIVRELKDIRFTLSIKLNHLLNNSANNEENV